jgi:outer membrane protein OmpA-like peptidoglycan-associated protein
MNQQIKIIALFLVALNMNSVGFAQQKGEDSTESIIIMKKARLDSLLEGIANSERALLDKRKQERLSKSKLKTQASATVAPTKPKKEQMNPLHNVQKSSNPANSDARIFQELNRINQRIDRLLMKRASQTKSNNYSGRSGTAVVPSPGGHSSTIFYQRGRRDLSNQSRNSEGNFRDTLSAEIKNLQKKMEDLQAKMTDSERSVHSAKKKEINRLKGHIDTLHTKLSNLNSKLKRTDRTAGYQGQQEYTKKARGNNSLSTLLKNYRQTIYFANNSTALNSADKTLISQLAQLIKRSDKQVTVLVQGYASKTGSALYNYKISQKRAEAVKNVLTNEGISAGKIETLGHGVNKYHNASAARIVELSLLID